ncbi:MAG: TRAP-type transporter substrate-binding component [Saliniramus fredricksonii]|uniref:TRAP-type transporter substrate-binding component n=1 Tax=Saliniramus fredricksonii TaxID=1653334 RepID=A0A0P7YAJ6_9HYPH|nr:TAXI family TRAP transporter solute-binding subunit [Saliniramus fredricksonii]KPQ11079.1 MAG: TRAP-type transporter substrate-binding component [Saliniramus fredricksonii]SCC78071.1 hypothetical protein GA0071312_0066 [Saliniramus fredricksonii]
MLSLKSTLKFGVAAAGLTLALGAAPSGALAQQQFISIGTGAVTGVYYPAGGAICRLMNQTRSEHGIRCSVESTGGSVFNINAIRGGDLEFGVAQSDVQYNAFNGEAQFEEGGAHEDLRAVFSLHPEPATIVARADSDINEFDDLLGNRVNIGNPGSGQRALMEVVMEHKGWSTDDFALASELAPAEMGQALCDNNIDAFVFTVGHPSGAIQEVTSTCDVRIVNADDDELMALVDEIPFYFPATIPAGMYRGTDEDVQTFGVGATFVSSADVDDDVVYTLVASVFDNLDDFRSLHPAFANLDAESMATQGMSAPMHPGAERYFREQGLID